MLLMIDNYDSFTYNLVQYFGELGQDVRVVRNDQITVADIGALSPKHLVLSPGPCSPAEAGVCVAAINAFAGKLPILGVCLGHQAIGAALGGRIVRAKVQLLIDQAKASGAESISLIPRNDAPKWSGAERMAALRGAGVKVEDLEIGRADLEDVFIEIMSGGRQ